MCFLKKKEDWPWHRGRDHFLACLEGPASQALARKQYAVYTLYAWNTRSYVFAYFAVVTLQMRIPERTLKNKGFTACRRANVPVGHWFRRSGQVYNENRCVKTGMMCYPLKKYFLKKKSYGNDRKLSRLEAGWSEIWFTLVGKISMNESKRQYTIKFLHGP